MIDREKLHAAVEAVRSMIDAGTLRSEIIRRFVSEHGGVYRDANGTYELRVAGLGRSCTAGPICLVAAWLEKANGALGAAR